MSEWVSECVRVCARFCAWCSHSPTHIHAHSHSHPLPLPPSPHTSPYLGTARPNTVAVLPTLKHNDSLCQPIKVRPRPESVHSASTARVALLGRREGAELVRVLPLRVFEAAGGEGIEGVVAAPRNSRRVALLECSAPCILPTLQIGRIQPTSCWEEAEQGVRVYACVCARVRA